MKYVTYDTGDALIKPFSYKIYSKKNWNSKPFY